MDKIILERALKKWGRESQFSILIEELSELIQAICKARRYLGVRSSLMDNVCEEIADVKIVIAQVETDPSYKKEIDKWVIIKMDRLASLLDK